MIRSLPLNPNPKPLSPQPSALIPKSLNPSVHHRDAGQDTDDGAASRLQGPGLAQGSLGVCVGFRGIRVEGLGFRVFRV